MWKALVLVAAFLFTAAPSASPGPTGLFYDARLPRPLHIYGTVHIEGKAPGAATVTTITLVDPIVSPVSQ